MTSKKQNKLMAEWFWIDRWDGSSAVLLSLEARGLYREMLSAAWRRGAKLPNDEEAVRRLIRATVREWRRSWPKIKPYWHPNEEGNLVNDTQVHVYAVTMASIQKASDRGKKGAQVKHKQKPEHRPSDAQAGAQVVHERKPPSPSPNGERTNQSSKANPFVTGNRDAYETEAMKLCRDIAELTGGDGAEIFATAAHYEGALRQKVNPANLTEDRLLNTVIDLRATLREEQAKRARRPA